MGDWPSPHSYPRHAHVYNDVGAFHVSGTSAASALATTNRSSSSFTIWGNNFFGFVLKTLIYISTSSVYSVLVRVYCVVLLQYPLLRRPFEPPSWTGTLIFRRVEVTDSVLGPSRDVTTKSSQTLNTGLRHPSSGEGAGKRYSECLPLKTLSVETLTQLPNQLQCSSFQLSFTSSNYTVDLSNSDSSGFHWRDTRQLHMNDSSAM